MRRIIWPAILAIFVFLPSSLFGQRVSQNRGSSNSKLHDLLDPCGDREGDLYKELDSSYKKSLAGNNNANTKPPTAVDRSALVHEMGEGLAYRLWLNEDVKYIIAPEERTAFLALRTIEEREQFIENFWAQRNPDPSSAENAFKNEHYRRIAFANEQFSTEEPGWETDRGRLYIFWGSPDGIEEHPDGVPCPSKPGKDGVVSPPFQVWQYRYLVGFGENVEIELVKRDPAGDFQMSRETRVEVNEAFSDEFHSVTTIDGAGARKRFWLDPQRDLGVPPTLSLKFKDLEALVISNIVRDAVPFSQEENYFYGTDETSLVLLTIHLPRTVPVATDAATKPAQQFNIFARVSSLTGRVVATFEETLPKKATFAAGTPADTLVFQRLLPLSTGLYRLDLAIKDVTSGNVGVSHSRLPVPRTGLERMGASSLVLADRIDAPTAGEMGSGEAILGAYRIYPHVTADFGAGKPINLFWQVYRVAVDGTAHKNRAEVTMRLRRAGEVVWEEFEGPDELENHGEEITIHKTLPAGTLAPGRYNIWIQAFDRIQGQSIDSSADFTVE